MTDERAQPANPDDGLESMDQLLRASRVCRFLDCSDRCLRRWVSAGRFPRPDLKIGTTLRWRKSTVEAWLRDAQA